MVNDVVLLGRLGQDPELKRTAAGKEFCVLSIATSIGKGDQKKTEWHRVEVWSAAAQTCERYLRRGSRVFVRGRLKSSEWEKDGAKRKDWRVVAYDVRFLDREEGTRGR